MIRFVLDGEVIEVANPDPTGTVLDLLRYTLRRTGTKEGCAEGDCGACTVVLGALEGERVKWRAVNACILFLPMLDGKALKTVESLGGQHPVQCEMANRDGSQCGFCTPGFVMSLYARSIAAEGTEGIPVKDVIAGNLCRCTGYGPILDAGEAVKPQAQTEDAILVSQLKSLKSDESKLLTYADPLTGTKRRGFIPRNSTDFATFQLENPQSQIVAGATDVGLWVTKQLRAPDSLTFIGNLPDLQTIDEDETGLTLGANVRYSQAREALARLHADLGELVRRIGGLQVRNAGTIGGNIANGSPIGDMPPALIALGAELTLRRGDDRRTIPLESYFLSYGKQDRAPGEWIERVRIPRPHPDTLIRIAKLSKRFDSDISALCGAFAIQFDGEHVVSARIAFGGMAGTPARAPAAEAALTGQPWSQATIEAAAQALSQDYQPLSDLRGSSGYRLTAAANLLRRLWHDEPVSVLDV